jgi:transcriptional antiterminator RfaH
MEKPAQLKHISMAIVKKSWYVLSTKTRSEKQVYNRLIQSGVEAFLPMYITIRQWSDRRKKVELPLFPSYIFVHITYKQFLVALNTQGVFKYVSFEGLPAIVPQRDIDNLKILLSGHPDLEVSNRDFRPGQKVKVVFGILKDLTGELVHCGRAKRLLVRIECIDQNLLVKIPANYLEGIA